MSTAQDLRTAAINDVGPVGEVVSYGSHLHPEWFSGRVPLLGTLLYTAPPAQAKEIEGLKAALTQVRKCLETANDLGNIIDTSQSHACTWPACKSEMVEQEPFGYWFNNKQHFINSKKAKIYFDATERAELLQPLYTSPPARAWVGLTEDEAHVCFKSANVWHAVEAKLKEKNHDLT